MSAEEGQISAATIGRLPIYLRALAELAADGVTTVNSEALATATGVQSALVRRDLSQFGSYGIRGVGYVVESLQSEIQDIVGGRRTWRVLLVGAGNLGQALARHTGLAALGFEIVAIIDVAPELIGTTIAGVQVHDQRDLAAVIETSGAELAVIATPAVAAQGVAEEVVAAGIGSILNMAPTTLHLDEDVAVRSVDFAQELQILAYHQAHRADFQAGVGVSGRTVVDQTAEVGLDSSMGGGR